MVDGDGCFLASDSPCYRVFGGTHKVRRRGKSALGLCDRRREIGRKAGVLRVEAVVSANALCRRRLAVGLSVHWRSYCAFWATSVAPRDGFLASAGALVGRSSSGRVVLSSRNCTSRAFSGAAPGTRSAGKRWNHLDVGAPSILRSVTRLRSRLRCSAASRE